MKEQFEQIRNEIKERLFSGNFVVEAINLESYILSVDGINFRIGFDHRNGSIFHHLSDTILFGYLNDEEEKQVFKHILNGALKETIRIKEEHLSDLNKELAILKSKI
jgi:hypothetical protein